MKRIHPILIRYILIFFLFASLLLLLFVPIYRYISNFTLRNELAYIADKLHSGVAVIDTTISALNNTALFTSRDARFRILKYNPSGAETNPYLLTELQKTFSSQILPHSLIADAGIIFSDNLILTRQRIFNAAGLYSFYGPFLQCGSLSYAQWMNILPSQRPFISKQQYRSLDYGSYEAITFVSHWLDTNPFEVNILYATLPVRNIFQVISDDEITAEGFIRIYDLSGNLLVDHESESHGKFHTITDKSTAYSIRFEIGVPETIINKKMLPVKNMILFFAIITAAITIVLSLLFAYRSFQPMQAFLTSINMAKYVHSEYENIGKIGHAGPLQSFRQVYSNLADSITAVNTKLEDSLHTIERQIQILREQMFDKALHRGIYDPEDQAGFQDVFPDFPKQFQLAAIRCDFPAEFSFQQNVVIQLELINQIKKKLDHTIFVQGIDANVIVLLLPLSGTEPLSSTSPASFGADDEWYQKLQLLRSELNRQGDFSLSFSLSDVFNKSLDLPRAWQQLQFIHIISGINYPVSVKQTKNIPDHNTQLPLNIATLQMIYSALSNANITTAEIILQECYGSLPDPEDYLISELTYNMLFDMIIQLKIENPITLLAIEMPVYVRGNQRDLFEKQFPGCFRQICENIKNHKESTITSFGQHVLAYINEHLYDPDLYITMVSDHFDISPPTLQKLVKSVSGQTFSVYVEKQRLSKAKEMLTEGMHSIQKISRECGFSNPNSFYKAFKRYYGFSPSNIMNNNMRG